MTVLQHEQRRSPHGQARRPDDFFACLDAETEHLFAVLHDDTRPAATRRQARNRLISLHHDTAAGLARRYRNRGETLDDLTQVACYALIKAVDGYNPEHGVPFAAYATPTILGELKRHFRDHGWHVRVPRPLQERYLAVRTATAELTQQGGHAPGTTELARHLQTTSPQTPNNAPPTTPTTAHYGCTCTLPVQPPWWSVPTASWTAMPP